MIVKLLTEHHLEFLSLKRGCRGSSESTHVKIPHCWKSHALAHLQFQGPNYTGFYCNETNSGMLVNLTLYMSTGPSIAVGSEYDYRSRGRESISNRSHTLVEIDHGIISMVIHLLLLI